MLRDHACAWVERYFAAWRTNRPEDVEALFTVDAVYHYGPFREPAAGRDEIVRRWLEGGAPDELIAHHEILAVDGDTAVVHWQVSLHTGSAITEMDGVLVLRFAPDGRCREHREWYAERSCV